MKLKFMRFICKAWDVFFTVVDIIQLKIWYYMVKYKEKLEQAAIQDQRDFGNLQDFEDWDKVQ